MFLNKLSKKERTGLLIAAAIVSAAFLDRFVISPINEKIQQINRETKINEKLLECNLRSLMQREVIAGQYRSYIQYVKKAGSAEEVVAEILGEIEKLARATGVCLVDTKPQSPKHGNFYKEYSVEVEAESEMSSFIEFLHQLNNSSQLFRAGKINLTLKGKDVSTIKVSILVTKIVI